MTLKGFAGAAIAFHYPPSPAHAVYESQVYNAKIAAPEAFILQQHLATSEAATHLWAFPWALLPTEREWNPGSITLWAARGVVTNVCTS